VQTKPGLVCLSLEEVPFPAPERNNSSSSSSNSGSSSNSSSSSSSAEAISQAAVLAVVAKRFRKLPQDHAIISVFTSNCALEAAAAHTQAAVRAVPLFTALRSVAVTALQGHSQRSLAAHDCAQRFLHSRLLQLQLLPHTAATDGVSGSASGGSTAAAVSCVLGSSSKLQWSEEGDVRPLVRVARAIGFWAAALVATASTTAASTAAAATAATAGGSTELLQLSVTAVPLSSSEFDLCLHQHHSSGGGAASTDAATAGATVNATTTVNGSGAINDYNSNGCSSSDSSCNSDTVPTAAAAAAAAAPLATLRLRTSPQGIVFPSTTAATLSTAAAGVDSRVSAVMRTLQQQLPLQDWMHAGTVLAYLYSGVLAPAVVLSTSRHVITALADAVRLTLSQQFIAVYAHRRHTCSYLC
jgi:hypothetical protein